MRTISLMAIFDLAKDQSLFVRLEWVYLEVQSKNLVIRSLNLDSRREGTDH